MNNGNEYLAYDDELDTNLQSLPSQVEENNTLQGNVYIQIQERMQQLNLIYIVSGYVPMVPAFIYNAGYYYNEGVSIIEQLPEFNELFLDTLYILNDNIFQQFGTPESRNFQNAVNERNLEIILRMIQLEREHPNFNAEIPPPPPLLRRQNALPNRPTSPTEMLDSLMEVVTEEYREHNRILPDTYESIQRVMRQMSYLYIHAGFIAQLSIFSLADVQLYNEEQPTIQQLPHDLFFDHIYFINDNYVRDDPVLREYQANLYRNNIVVFNRVNVQQVQPPPFFRPPTPPPELIINPINPINPYEIHQEAGIISRNPLWNKIRNIIYKDGIVPGHYIFLVLDPRPFPSSGLTRENIKQVLIKFVELTNRRPEYKRNRTTELQNIFSTFSIQLGPDDLNLIRVVFDYMFYLDIPELYAKYISKLTRTCLQAYATNQGNEMNENRNGRFQEMGMSCVNGRLERLYTVALEVLTLLANDQLLTSSPPKKSVDKIKELKRALDVASNKKDAHVTLVTREKIERLFQKWVTQDVPLPDNQGAEEPQEDPLVGKSVEEIKAHALNYIQRKFSEDDGIDFSTDDFGLRMIEEYLGTIDFQPISLHRGELLGLLGGGKRFKTKTNKKTKKQRKKQTKTLNKRKQSKHIKKHKSINKIRLRRKTRSKKNYY